MPEPAPVLSANGEQLRDLIVRWWAEQSGIVVSEPAHLREAGPWYHRMAQHLDEKGVTVANPLPW